MQSAVGDRSEINAADERFAVFSDDLELQTKTIVQRFDVTGAADFAARQLFQTFLHFGINRLVSDGNAERRNEFSVFRPNLLD